MESYAIGTNTGTYNLNEPMLWNQTHRDVHPDPTRYDEVRDRTYAYAAAIKSADPSALTAGPTVWGWTAYGSRYRRAGNWRIKLKDRTGFSGQNPLGRGRSPARPVQALLARCWL
jgi:hypothetical protein